MLLKLLIYENQSRLAAMQAHIYLFLAFLRSYDLSFNKFTRPYLAVVQWLRRAEVVDNWLIAVVHEGPEGVQLRARRQ